MKSKDELIGLHSRLLEEYADCYFQEPADVPKDMTKQEMASGILEHFGMVYRYTGDDELLQQFQAMSRDERRALSLDAALYVADSRLADAALALSEETLLSEAQWEQARSLFFRRDEVSVITDVIRLIAFEFIENGDSELEAAVLKLLRMEQRLDKALKKNPALMLAADASVRPLREYIVIDMDPIRQWWLTDQPRLINQQIENDLQKWVTDLVETAQQKRKVVNLADWIRSARKQFETASTQYATALSAKTADAILCRLSAADLVANVEFRPEKDGIHIVAYAEEGLPTRLANAKVCFLDHDNRNLDIQLDANAYAWASWESIPDSVHMGLVDVSGKLIGILELTDDK